MLRRSFDKAMFWSWRTRSRVIPVPRQFPPGFWPFAHSVQNKSGVRPRMGEVGPGAEGVDGCFALYPCWPSRDQFWKERLNAHAGNND